MFLSRLVQGELNDFTMGIGQKTYQCERHRKLTLNGRGYCLMGVSLYLPHSGDPHLLGYRQNRVP